MEVDWSVSYRKGGVNRGYLRFTNPTLSEMRWPVVDVTGSRDGPRLCVMAGLHIDEVSSIQAAVSLPDHIDVAALAGTVSIIPIVNVPAKFSHTGLVPMDGKNLHWVFPGRSDGTFTEALADALLNEWMAGSEAVIDLHGGDIGEAQRPFVLFQKTADEVLNSGAEALARGFNPDYVMQLDLDHMNDIGRCCTALGARGRIGIVTERGDNGLLDWDAVNWHVAGVLNACRLLGLLEGGTATADKSAVLIDKYTFLRSTADGLVYHDTHPGDRVVRGQRIATLRDEFQQPIDEILAPDDGYIIWRTTMLFARSGSWIGALGRPA
jgi:uncharacterized protein